MYPHIMETGCNKTISCRDSDNEDAPIGILDVQQQQQHIQQQDNTTYDQWNQQQEQMKQKIRRQQIRLWNETYYKAMETANGAEEITTHANKLTENFSTNAPKDSK